MQWTDIQVICDKRFEDVFDFVSGEICPLGIQIEDYSNLEQDVLEIAHIDLIEEELLKKDKSKIIVHHYISPQIDAQQSRLILENLLCENNVDYTIKIEFVNQEDWESGWKKYYHPVDIGSRLTICPSWQQTNSNKIIMQLDPGMAFGTGTHETTMLCLERLDSLIKGGERILDVGTGSGILGIAACLLGAESADGVDIDPTAVKVATENAQLNKVDNKFSISIGDLSQTATGKYDIVIANIVANAVIALSKDVPNLLKQNGIYITSGIIGARKNEVVACLENLGFKILNIYTKNDWVCIEATI